MGDSSAIGWVLAHAAGGLLAFAAPRFLIAVGIPYDRWIVEMGARAKLHLNREAVIWAATVLVAFGLYAGSVAFSKDHSWDPQVPEILMRVVAAVKPIYVVAFGIGVAVVGIALQLMRGPETVTRVVSVPIPSLPVASLPAHSLSTTPIAEPVASDPPQRPLSAYEAELKLKAIDRVLAILSDDMEPVIQKAPALAGWWNALKAPATTPNFRQDLLAFRDEFKEASLKLDSLRNKLPQYQDLVTAVQQSYYNDALKNIEKYLVTYMYVEDSIKPEASGEALKAFLDPPMGVFVQTMVDFTAWRNNARSRVLELRQAI
jgi:hypothetical protein